MGKIPEKATKEPSEHKTEKFHSCQFWRNHLQIGDIVDARDDQEKWYESVIRYIELKGDRKLLYVHYIGWDKKYDEEIFADDFTRIAKRNSKTRGLKRDKGRNKYSYP